MGTEGSDLLLFAHLWLIVTISEAFWELRTLSIRAWSADIIAHRDGNRTSAFPSSGLALMHQQPTPVERHQTALTFRGYLPVDCWCCSASRFNRRAKNHKMCTQSDTYVVCLGDCIRTVHERHSTLEWQLRLCGESISLSRDKRKRGRFV